MILNQCSSRSRLSKISTTMTLLLLATTSVAQAKPDPEGIQLLPKPVMILALSYLPPDSLGNAAQVCREWHAHAQEIRNDADYQFAATLHQAHPEKRDIILKGVIDEASFIQLRQELFSRFSSRSFDTFLMLKELPHILRLVDESFGKDSIRGVMLESLMKLAAADLAGQNDYGDFFPDYALAKYYRTSSQKLDSLKNLIDRGPEDHGPKEDAMRDYNLKVRFYCHSLLWSWGEQEKPYSQQKAHDEIKALASKKIRDAQTCKNILQRYGHLNKAKRAMSFMQDALLGNETALMCIHPEMFIDFYLTNQQHIVSTIMKDLFGLGSISKKLCLCLRIVNIFYARASTKGPLPINEKTLERFHGYTEGELGGDHPEGQLRIPDLDKVETEELPGVLESIRDLTSIVLRMNRANMQGT